MEDKGLQGLLDYNIYLTRGWDQNQVWIIYLFSIHAKLAEKSTCSPLFPVLFAVMMALRSTETHNITLKNLTPFGPDPEHPRVPIRFLTASL